MPSRTAVLIALLSCAAWGCQEGTESGPSEAEIPQPGPALEDPGPAPEGQWEPSDEGEQADESSEGETDLPDEDATSTDDETAGADEAASDDNETEASEDGDSGADATPLQGEDVTLKLQPWEDTQKLIAAHQGKVVVVDFWSTSCLPCRREFPHLVALQKAYPEDVACVAVSLDYAGRASRPPETYREIVLKFLDQQQASIIDNVLSTDDPDELEQRLKLPPIPLVWVFDRSGQRRQTFDNGDRGGEEFTYEADVVPFVESLLAES